MSQTAPGCNNTSDSPTRPSDPRTRNHIRICPLKSSLSLSLSLARTGFLIPNAARYFGGGWYPIMMTLLYFYPLALSSNVIMIELHEELLNIITIILTTTSGPSWSSTGDICPVLSCVLSKRIITTMFIFISLSSRNKEECWGGN